MTRNHNARHTALCRAVREILTLWGCLVVPVKNGPTPFTRRDGTVGYRRGAILVGASDIIACSPSGRFIAVEVKTGTGKPTAAQVRFLGEVEKRGALALIVRDTVDGLEAVRDKVVS